MTVDEKLDMISELYRQMLSAIGFKSPFSEDLEKRLIEIIDVMAERQARLDIAIKENNVLRFKTECGKQVVAVNYATKTLTIR